MPTANSDSEVDSDADWNDVREKKQTYKPRAQAPSAQDEGAFGGKTAKGTLIAGAVQQNRFGFENSDE